MAEGGESGYEGDLESEYDSNSELQREPKNESLEELPNIRLLPHIIYTAHGHRMETEYPIFNLNGGHLFHRFIFFETHCPTLSTIWWCEVKVERVVDGGPISYWITLQRLDTEALEMDAAAWVRFRNATSNAFFHEEKFEREAGLEGHEIRGLGTVPVEKLQALPDNELVLRVDLIARLCHGNIKRKRESNSSSDNW